MHVLVFGYKLVFADLSDCQFISHVKEKSRLNICDVPLPHFLVLWDQLIRFQAEQTNRFTFFNLLTS